MRALAFLLLLGIGCTTQTLGTIPLLRRGIADPEPPPTTARVEGQDCITTVFGVPIPLAHRDLDLGRAFENAVQGTGADALRDATIELWDGDHTLPARIVGMLVTTRCLVVRGIPVPSGEGSAAAGPPAGTMP